MSSRPELKLDWCSYQAAKYAVEKWHYSQTMPVGKMVKIGVWEDGQFLGAIIFGLGGGGAGDGRRYGLARNFDVVELERVALRQHKTSVSRIVAIAIRLLQKAAPKIRLIVSYADPQQGHLGVIYQAGGWIYIGKSADDWQIVWPNNRKTHSRIAREHVQFGQRKAVDISGGKREIVPGKYRYLYPLDPEIRARILPLAKPYPKRAGSSGGAASVIHVEEGGSTPTPALQEVND